MTPDFYAILGISRDATTDQIRSRFLKLTREKHPDRFQGEAKRQAEIAFQEITQAFNVLSHPERRRLHDAALARPQREAAHDPSQVAKVYLQRGVKAYREKRFIEAADNFDRATKTDPANGLAWHHLARVCLQQERWWPRAGEAAANACRLEPMKPSYLKLAGEVFTRLGDRDKALKYYREALQWGGEDPQIQEAIEELSDRKKKSLLGGLFGRAER